MCASQIGDRVLRRPILVSSTNPKDRLREPEMLRRAAKKVISTFGLPDLDMAAITHQGTSTSSVKLAAAIASRGWVAMANLHHMSPLPGSSNPSLSSRRI